MTKDRIDREVEREIIEEQLQSEPPLRWHPGDPPPPWQPPRSGNLKTYKWAMIHFVEWHLNQLPDPDLTPDLFRRHADEVAEWYKKDGPEVCYAELGDIEPLRKKYPHLAGFLHLPVGRWKSRGCAVSVKAELAADLIPAVVAIWQRTYNKKVRRFGPTTVEIVADRFGVEVDDVERVLSRRKLTRHRSNKQQPSGETTS